MSRGDSKLIRVLVRCVKNKHTHKCERGNARFLHDWHYFRDSASGDILRNAGWGDAEDRIHVKCACRKRPSGSDSETGRRNDRAVSAIKGQPQRPGIMPTVANSSLTYEILMYLNSYYFGMFAVCELGMGLFKAANLPLPSTSKALMELALLLFLLATEGGRIYLGRKGNLTERGIPILIGIILTIPSSLATLYLLLWQYYVLRLEVILCSIQLVLLASELVIAIMCLIAIYRPPPPEKWCSFSIFYSSRTMILFCTYHFA